MNKAFQTLISSITTVSICASMMGVIPAFAEGTDSPSQPPERNLMIKYLGKGETPAKTFSTARLSSADIKSEFWVGVAVDNVNTADLFKDGIYSLEVAFEYDTNYVEPYFNLKKDDDWQEALEKGNLADAGNDSHSWDKNQYEIISIRETDLDTTTDREDNDFLNNGSTWKMCTVCINYKDTATGDMRFKGIDSSDIQYLVKLPFILRGAPADTDIDQPQTVLSFVLGPETFDIGSGQKGVNPISSWKKTVVDTDGAKNLKTLFTFGGDVKLFGTSAAIDDITAWKAKAESSEGGTGGEEEEDVSYPLYWEDLETNGFSSDVNEYYVSVPNETKEIILKITSSEQLTITANDVDVGYTPSGGVSTTNSITLNEFDINNKDSTNGGYDNTIIVKVSDDIKYTIHVRRLLKPKIELNPGNSPYGEIERMSTKYLGEEDGWSDEKIAEAKKKFNAGNKFVTGYIPTGKSSKTFYSTAAWDGSEDPKFNMDRNESAVFAFEYNGFTDPGFKIINSLGNEVDLNSVERSIEVCVLPAQNMRVEITPDMYKKCTVTGAPSDDVFTNIQLTGAASKVIQPDIYDLVYSFTDDEVGEKFSFVRKIVMIPKMGDTNLDSKISSGDLAAIKNFIAKVYTSVDSTVKIETYNLFVYRTLDTNSDVKISTGDYAAIKNTIANVNVIPYYVPFTK